MNEETLIMSMLQKALDKLDVLTSVIAATQLDHEKTKGETTKSILEQSTLTDTKLIEMERRIEHKISARAEKVDKWFDDMQTAISSVENKITGVSIKVGIISTGATLLIGGIVTAIVKFLFTASSAVGN